MNIESGQFENRTNKRAAFTIMELMVAMALLLILIAISGLVFRSAVKAYRTASATTEILRKYQAIVSQLNSDFRGLQKGDEIFIAWVPGIDTDGDDTVDEFNRFDRILFFSSGAANFESYNLWPELPPWGTNINDVENVIIHNNIARISYMLAKDGQDMAAQGQEPRTRVLARSQHIYTPGYICLTDPLSPLTQSAFPDYDGAATPLEARDDFSAATNNYFEYDTITDLDWLNIPWSNTAASTKSNMLEEITDINIFTTAVPSPPRRGLQYDPDVPSTHHLVLSQGVGQFAVQGWSDQLQRWVPQVDPDGDGNYADTDFVLNGSGVHSVSIPGILYPQKIYAMGSGVPAALVPPLNQANFNDIPGLGRALKFTFTLYDSNQIFPEGKTFTHIIYLN